MLDCNRTRLHGVGLLALALVFAAAPLVGQNTGAVAGRLSDSVGPPLPGGLVTLVQLQTGAVRQAIADETGNFRVLRLSPGSYDIRVSVAGFQEQLRRAVSVSAGEETRCDFTLTAGSLDETVEVEGQVSSVSQSIAEWGGRVDREELSTLPLNGRDLFELASQEIGASIAGTADRGITSGQGIQISVFGSRPNMNAFQIDGVNINDATGSAPSSAGGLLLGLEGIQEVKIVTSPFSPEYGRTAGALFTAVSRSGSNEFHGSAFELLRNMAMDARNYFDSPDEKIPPLRRNQFGGALGGPILRERLFFLANYEGLREQAGQTTRSNVPTANARQGLLPQPDGGVKQVQVSPAIRPYMDLYPRPNGAEFGNGVGEFISESIDGKREDFVAVRLDVPLKPKFPLAARYTFDDAERTVPDPFRIWTFSQDSRYQFLHSQLQWIVSPQTISTMILAFSRVRNSELGRTRSDVDDSLSFVPGKPLGTIEVTGLTGLGGGSRARLRPREFITHTVQASGDLIGIRGNHTFKLGTGFDRIHFNQVSDISATGVYWFTSLEDFLLAKPGRGEAMAPGSDSARRWRFSQFFFYLQDEVRLSERLGLSLGVRYEMASTPWEVDGKTATLADPLRESTPRLGGPLFENPSKDNLAPRVGVAWDAAGDGRTVVRLGAGIFFDLLGTRELVVAGARVPPLFRRLSFTRPPFPSILSGTQTMNPPSAVDALDYRLNQPYTAQWQLSIERQVADRGVVSVAYAGSRGIHLMGQLGNINTSQPVTLEDGSLFFPANVTRINPAFREIGMRKAAFNSAYHSFSLQWSSHARRMLSYQFKYTFGKSIDETSNSIYADFRNSDLIPTMFDYRLNRGLSDFDVRHVFAGHAKYSLPEFGPVWVKAFSRMDLIALARVQSGNPFSPRVGFDRANLLGRDDLGQRPDIARNARCDCILGDPARYFDPLAFALPAAGRYGNLGRGTLTGPGLALLDTAIQRVVWEREEVAIRLRAEFFNVLNHPNFQLPSETALFNSRGERLATAGRITETSTTSRQIQLSLRCEF